MEDKEEEDEDVATEDEDKEDLGVATLTETQDKSSMIEV